MVSLTETSPPLAYLQLVVSPTSHTLKETVHNDCNEHWYDEGIKASLILIK